MAGVAELAQEFGRADERGVVYLDTAGRSIIPQSVLDVGTAALGLKVGAWVHWVE
jgi:selenocysteine lyase/cysteine desulfurase